MLPAVLSCSSGMANDGSLRAGDAELHLSFLLLLLCRLPLLLPLSLPLLLLPSLSLSLSLSLRLSALRRERGGDGGRSSAVESRGVEGTGPRAGWAAAVIISAACLCARSFPRMRAIV